MLADRLSYSGGVLIEGVRACGKTETARAHSSSEVALDSGVPSVQVALDNDPNLLLEGANPRLIDEWQLEPSLWNIVRREIDRRGEKGQFILTGSSVPAEDAQRHSGAYRIARLRMRPMTLAERRIGDTSVSLQKLFSGAELAPMLDNPFTVSDALDHLAHGGWPTDLELPTNQALAHLTDYVDDVVNRDVERLDGESRRDPDLMLAVLRSLARNVASEVSYATVAKDISGTRTTKPDTVAAYINALRRLYVVEEQPAWAPHLRSRAKVRQSPKLHFVDPSLALAIHGASADSLRHDLETAGFLFESQVVQHLRVFAEAHGGKVYHYRDSSKREVDAIVQLRDGRWAAVEIKLGQRQISKAEESLQSFAEVIDTKKSGAPEFMAIITSDGPVLQLPSGIVTFPLHAMGSSCSA